MLLIFLYPIKAIILVWADSLGLHDFGPLNLQTGYAQKFFGPAFTTSCLAILLLALVLWLPEPTLRRQFTPRDVNRFKSVRFLVIVSILFVGTTVARIYQPFHGLLASLVYVINHRVIHFGMALVVFASAIQGRLRLARYSFLVWLIFGVIQFALFASKSYIFFPVVDLLFIVFFQRCRLIPRGATVALVGLLTFIYPAFNQYRSALASGTSVQSALAVWASSTGAHSDQSWSFLSAFNYFGDALNRLVGIEWFMRILEAPQVPGEGQSSLIGTISGTADMMRSIAQLDGANIGIAPSLCGQAFLMSHSLWLVPVLVAAICLGFALLCFLLNVAFPPISNFTIAPLAILVFGIVTDGALVSLYWDIPALLFACAAGAFISSFKMRTWSVPRRSSAVA
jgi:uncharacterized protein YhhL (DUF1145 family)